MLREEDHLRAEIRWLIERARVALDLPTSAVAGCTDEQIAHILEAQGIPALPPPLDELMRVAGVEERGTLLGELYGQTGLGLGTMLCAKDHARQTAAYTGSDETFGPDRAVFLSDPGGSVLWVETGKLDSPVWGLSERSPFPGLDYARLACMLEEDVIAVEVAAERQ